MATTKGVAFVWMLVLGSLTMAAVNARAATPTYYTDRATFESTLDTIITDEYGTPPYPAGFNIYDNATFSAFLGETDYVSTGFLDFHFHLTDDMYCSGCNGSFRLSFSTTSVTDGGVGVFGVGVDIPANDSNAPRVAFITFGDTTTGEVALPPGVSFFGVTAPELVESIHFGLTGGGATTLSNFVIDNLTIGNALANADLAITMSDLPDPVDAGGAVAYTVTVENLGPADAPDVTVTDTLPAGTAFVSAGGTGWTCVEAGGIVTCDAGALTVGLAPAITIVLTAPMATGTIINTAVVSNTAVDPVASNDTAVEETLVQGADLTITAVDSPDPVLPGSILTWGLTVGNSGPAAAVDAVISSTLPAGVTFGATSGCAEDPGGVPTCTLAGLVSGGSAPVTITAAVDQLAGGPLDATFSVASTTPDPDLVNNTANTSTSVAAADWGDAGGVGYPTLFADNGARHQLGAGPVLGALIDAETDGFATAAGDGDDNDGLADEDGVVFVTPLDPGQLATVEVTASGAGLYLNAWVDYNDDGDWNDADEQIFTDVELVPGVNSLAFTVPGTATVNVTTLARFRASLTPGLGPSGPAPDGEVEDYEIATVPVELRTFSVE